MTYKERLYQEQMSGMAKIIILDDMLTKLFDNNDYEDLSNKDKIKVHVALRERKKLFNCPKA